MWSISKCFCGLLVGHGPPVENFWFGRYSLQLPLTNIDFSIYFIGFSQRVENVELECLSNQIKITIRDRYGNVWHKLKRCNLGDLFLKKWSLINKKEYKKLPQKMGKINVYLFLYLKLFVYFSSLWSNLIMKVESWSISFLLSFFKLVFVIVQLFFSF